MLTIEPATGASDVERLSGSIRRRWRTWREARRLSAFRSTLSFEPDYILCRALVRCGWTTADYRDTITMLTGWAFDQQTTISRLSVSLNPRSAWALPRLLAGQIDHSLPLPVTVTRAWLAVLASGTGDDIGALRETLDSLDGVIVTWVRLREHGPLAYAAGLSRKEAEDLVAAGGWDEQSLRTLAALRGYRLPSFA